MIIVLKLKSINYKSNGTEIESSKVLWILYYKWGHESNQSLYYIVLTLRNAYNFTIYYYWGVPHNFYTLYEINLIRHNFSSVYYNWNHWTKPIFHTTVYFCRTSGAIGESTIVNFCTFVEIPELSNHHCTIVL